MKTLRAHGFNQRPRFEQVAGYLERNEPLLDQPDRKATSFVTSHFYLDDFVQSSEDPNPRPLQHTHQFARKASALPQRPRTRTCGWRGGTKGTAEPALLRTTWRPRGRRAGQQRAGAALHHGPPAQHCRRRSGGSGPHRRRGRGARSRAVPLSAEYVRLNVLPRPGPAQPPPQIIGRPSDVERLLDEAGQRAQEVERGAEAIEETAAVAAEKGEVAVAAEGVGGAFGYLGGLAEGAAALTPTAGEVAGTLAGGSWRGGNGGAYGLARGTGWVLENTLFRPQQGSEDAAVQDVRSANNMNDDTQPQHFTLRTDSSTSGSPASSRASSQSGFRVQAQSNNTPRPFSWDLNPVALPQSQPSSRASSSSGRQSLPPARDIEAA